MLVSVPDSSTFIVRCRGRESCPIDNQLTVSIDPLPIHQLPIKCDSASHGSSNSDKSAADVFHVPSSMVKRLFELLERNIEASWNSSQPFALHCISATGSQQQLTSQPILTPIVSVASSVLYIPNLSSATPSHEPSHKPESRTTHTCLHPLPPTPCVSSRILVLNAHLYAEKAAASVQ
ncbi:hypothetical protein AUP68_05820 [Ilyonectria robusta]